MDGVNDKLQAIYDYGRKQIADSYDGDFAFLDYKVQSTSQSPIEKLFYAAYECIFIIGDAVTQSLTAPKLFHSQGPGEGFIPFSPDLWPEDVISRGFDTIHPQAVIGKFRVDFLITRVVRNTKTSKVNHLSVVVECDGHDFHERTKEQAQKDKERDRELQAKGFLVLRFTGSEIWRDAIECARAVDEVLRARICEIAGNGE